MKFEFTISELGDVLKKISEKNDLDILIKSALSGGWMTVTGKAQIVKVPDSSASGCKSKKDNIIHIKISEDAEKETLVKLTGVNNKKFNVDISAGRYRELSSNNLTINAIKINENETKIRIDENIIFTIKNNVDNILNEIK
ncbi:UDP-N-acetylglucosamine pyrophosphorylase [uncultured Clostridium sp.]|uniref:UDP-N-acetylglucosamine pyrophosphorylase n=1 Tax=uncultured Clostridium sp. TaxID=59620 RepID=UPI0025F1E445|nr:UDP-N-acetylglucosamine pyrophosphorylase [uncultured Clostridium sp.]